MVEYLSYTWENNTENRLQTYDIEIKHLYILFIYRKKVLSV